MKVVGYRWETSRAISVTAILTGSAAGMGRAIARSLSHTGMAVVINGRREAHVQTDRCLHR